MELDTTRRPRNRRANRQGAVTTGGRQMVTIDQRQTQQGRPSVDGQWFHWITVTNGTIGLANRRTRRPLVNYGSNEISMDQRARSRSHSPAASSSSSDLSDEEEVDNLDEDSSDTDYIDDSPQVGIGPISVVIARRFLYQPSTNRRERRRRIPVRRSSDQPDGVDLAEEEEEDVDEETVNEGERRDGRAPRRKRKRMCKFFCI